MACLSKLLNFAKPLTDKIMRINQLTLRNFRLYGDTPLVINFSPDRHAMLLIGENGCGKTTLLNAVSLLLAPYLGQFPGGSESQLSEYDVHFKNNNRRGDYASIEGTLTMHTGEQIDVKRYKRGSRPAPGSQIKELKAYAAERINEIEMHGDTCVLPVIAYYGTERGRIEAPERKRNFQRDFERFDGYVKATTPQTNFKTFFAWFDLKEDEERRIRDERWERHYKLPALEAVRRALENFVGDDYVKPAIKLHPLRFVMHQRDTQRELRIEQLSDGYRIIIAMIADIAARMAELNPSDDPEAILSTPGIIMIDEIDLHLHPSWQRKIMSQLVSTFKNVQFIITTHSPLVALDATDEIEVMQMGEHGASAVINDLQTLDVNEVLVSDLFNLPTPQARKWDDDIARRDELLSQAELSVEDHAELAKLDERLKYVTSGSSLVDRRTAELIRKLASKLGIQ